MQCSSCDFENPHDYNFCGDCGHKLSIPCQSCGFNNIKINNFCGQCGEKLKQEIAKRAEAEHRHLTVMFCDMVDSTQISQNLDTETFRSINLLFQDICAKVIQKHGGFVARFMGDGILAYFGYPTAQENDPERAVLAGLELVEAIENISPPPPVGMKIRVGLASGRVIVGDIIGEGAAQEAAVIGDTPNLAARVQGLAAPNSVYISDETQNLCGDQFIYIDLGRQEVKGFTDPQNVWQVVRENKTLSRFQATRDQNLSELVGRDQEILTAATKIHQALDGDGQMILICGDAGIGKSRLTDGILKLDVSGTFKFHHIQCSPNHQDTSLHPLVNWLIRETGIEQNDGDDETIRKLQNYLVSAKPSGNHEINMFLLNKLLALSNNQAQVAKNLSDHEAKTLTFELLKDLLFGTSSKENYFIILEDLHWIDPTSLELFDYLNDVIKDKAALLLCTYRPEFKTFWHEHPHVTLFSLGRINKSSCLSLISDLTSQKKLPNEIIAQIISKTDGIPLFVEELTKNLLESGLLKEDGDEYILLKPLSSLAIPNTLQDSLMARLDRLSSIKEILQIGAVIGREFPFKLLALVTRFSKEDLARHLVTFVESGLIHQKPATQEKVYIFKHALVRDTAYDSILRSNLQTIHGHVAAALETHFPATARTEPALLALHYEKAGIYEKSIDYWHQAAENANNQSGIKESIDLNKKALSLIKNSTDTVDSYRQEIKIKVSIAKALRIFDNYDEAFDVLTEALALADQHNLAAEKSNIHFWIGNIYFPQGKVEACMAEHRLAYQYAQSSFEPELEAQALSGLGDAYYLRGHMNIARDEFEKCINICEKNELDDIKAANFSMLAWTTMFSRNLYEAVTIGEKAVVYAKSKNYKRGELIARQLLCVAYIDMGDLAKASSNITESFKISNLLGSQMFVSYCFYHQARLEIARQEIDLARISLDKGLKIARASALNFVGPSLLGLKGVLSDDPIVRDANWQEGMKLIDQGAPAHNQFIFCRDIISSCIQMDDRKSIETHRNRLYAYTRTDPLEWSDLIIKWADLILENKSNGMAKKELIQKVKSMGYNIPI